MPQRGIEMSEPIENIEQLRPCPFCGKAHPVYKYAPIIGYKPEGQPINGQWRDCVSMRDHGDRFDVATWQTRPIEDALRADLAAAKAEYLSAAQLVAEMHAAAVGHATGPVRGLVEDVLDIRDELVGARVEISGMQAELQQAREELIKEQCENERLSDAMLKIEAWSNAYPVDVFPEPDFERVQDLLKAGGQSLSCVSASNMRHVVKGVGEIARSALNPPEQEATE
jgi:hypothetical protein